MKAVFASGKLGSSARTGPGRVGSIVMTPSIPVSEPDCVWPGKKPAHMIRTARAIESLRNCIRKFTLTASYRSINDETRMSKHEEIQNDAMTSAVRAWFFIRHSDFVIKGARFFN